MKKITASPHIHSNWSTQASMLMVALALLPSAIWGIAVFGLRALLVILVSIASCMVTEWALGLISKQSTLRDCSALVTGLLIGMNMSSSVKLFIPVIASVFAMAVVKWIFGGLGCNWMNPALGGRVFVFFSFTSLMSDFRLPAILGANAVSAASPLSFIKTAIAAGEVSKLPAAIGANAVSAVSAASLASTQVAGLSSTEILQAAEYPATQIAQKLASSLGISPYTIDSFLGFESGCIGEVSALMLLIGGIFLLATKVISFHIPVSYLATYAVLSKLFGGFPNGTGFGTGELIAPLFRGGLMLGAFFMATDYVTTPITFKGQLVFGFGCGVMTFLLRTFGSLPEAVSLAIIFMNILSPTIDRYIVPKRFGEPKRIKEVKA
jgi:electron transport complex protein RnfD